MASLNGAPLGCLRTLQVERSVQELPSTAAMFNILHYGNLRVVHKKADDSECCFWVWEWRGGGLVYTPGFVFFFLSAIRTGVPCYSGSTCGSGHSTGADLVVVCHSTYVHYSPPLSAAVCLSALWRRQAGQGWFGPRSPVAGVDRPRALLEDAA